MPNPRLPQTAGTGYITPRPPVPRSGPFPVKACCQLCVTRFLAIAMAGGSLLLPPVTQAAGPRSVPLAQLAMAKLPGHRTHLKNVTFVAFDTETTGFNPKKDRIIEVGAIKFRNGEIIDKRSWLINPKRRIPYWARRVHGIDDKMVADQPEFDEIYAEFVGFIEGSVLIAHNARFDISFLSEEAARHNLKRPPNEVIDSLALFRKWFPLSESYSLEGLAEHLEIEAAEFHRALADSMYIYWILGRGMVANRSVNTLGKLEKAAGGSLDF